MSENSTETQSQQTLLTLTQRLLLVELLSRRGHELDKRADQLDQEITKKYGSDIDDDVADDYDRAVAEVVHLQADAETAWQLEQLIDSARLVSLGVDIGGDPVSIIARVFVSAWTAGADVGAVVVEAAAAAQRTVFNATEEHLTSNRPGSWEAALLENAIESSGWDSETS
jgi:hypothetical protein